MDNESMKKSKSSLISIPLHGDPRGMLSAVEGSDDIPFEIKRVFCIFSCDGDSVRGKHANRNSEFVMQCITGECKLTVFEWDGSKNQYFLSSPEQAVYMPTMTWKEMYDFSEDAVLIVYASEHFDPDEYIYDYDAFLEEMKKFMWDR